MAIDPNIALQAQTVQAPDLLGNYLKMAQLKNLIGQGKERDLEMQKQQIAMNDAKTIKELATKHTKPNDDGSQTFDEPGFITDLQARNPMAANTYRKSSAETGEQVAKMTGEQLANSKKTLDLISNAYAGLLAKPGGATPQDVQQTFTGLVQQGIVPPEAAKSAMAEIPSDPALVHGFLLGHALKQMDASKRMELALGEVKDIKTGGKNVMFNVNKLTGEVTPVKVLGTDAESAPGKLEQDISNGVVPGDQAGAYRKKEQTSMSTVFNAGGMGGFTPEALNMEADRYRKTGQLGNYGMGTAGTEAKTRVINKAAALERDEGKIPDLASTGMSYKADAASLNQMQKNRDQLVTFEHTALANLDQFLNLAKKMPDSGSAWLNKPIREMAAGGLGSEAQAAAKTALMVARPEFAKINQGALNGVLSDSARKEVETTMPDDATYGQFLAAANVLKQDAANRHRFFDEGIDEIKGRVKNAGKPGTSKENPLPVTDEASYNALPPDSWYKAKDGSVGRKPR